MASKLQKFCFEIDAIQKEIKKSSSKTLKDSNLSERLIQLLETWQAIKNYIETFFNDRKTLTKIDHFLEEIVRDAYKKVPKNKHTVHLRDVKNTINTKILIEEVKAAPQKELGKTIEHGLQNKFLEEIPDLSLQLTPKSLIGWKSHIKDFLHKYPFEQNIFIMTRYADSSKKIIETVIAEIHEFEHDSRSFYPIIANKHKITDDLYNPIACLLCCQFGVAIFDQPAGNLAMHNPNVAYELGYMHLLQRECLILKSNDLKAMPTDILLKIYEGYSSPENAKEKVRCWLEKVVHEEQ